MTAAYQMPTVRDEIPAPDKTVVLIPSGDLRESANVPAWPFQQELERLEKDGEAGKDDVAGAEKRLDGLTKKHTDEIDDMLKNKEAELLEV